MFRFSQRRVTDPLAQQNFEQLEALIPDAGDLKPTAATKTPAGWLLCDGSAVSRTTYGALFGAIGTTYGSGDGSSTFNLPDLRGRAPIGAGTGAGLTARALGDEVGEETHRLTIAEMPSHTHPPAHNLFAETIFAAQGQTGASAAAINTSASSTGPAGGDGAHNNMQPSLAINWLIRT